MALYKETLPWCEMHTKRWSISPRKKLKKLKQPSADLQTKKYWLTRGSDRWRSNALKCKNIWKNKDTQRKKLLAKCLPSVKCLWTKKESQIQMMTPRQSQRCQKHISWPQPKRNRTKSYEKRLEYLILTLMAARSTQTVKPRKQRLRPCSRKSIVFFWNLLIHLQLKRRKERNMMGVDRKVNLQNVSIRRRRRNHTRNTKVRILKQAFDPMARSGRRHRRRHKRSHTEKKKSPKESKDNENPEGVTRDVKKSDNESGVESAGSSPDKTRSSRKKSKKRRKHSHSPYSDKSDNSRSPSPHKDEKKTRRHSRSRSRSQSRSPSHRRHHSRSRSHSRRSRSKSLSYSPADKRRSASRGSPSPRGGRDRKKSFSPIRKRRDSPSFLDRRRITSARKLPIPYNRPSASCGYSSDSQMSTSSRSRSRSATRSRHSSGESSQK
ncbi:uncharacterized protein [Apostichopus japonicus]|uniref:uncharacterized protein isoform X2 n=1 Tax=Stichopus japonicus TaxID=307972 RepID=UPI003AB7767B